MPPREVVQLRPTEVASILGNDRTDAVRPVPLLDEDVVEPAQVDPNAPRPQGQKIRRVM